MDGLVFLAGFAVLGLILAYLGFRTLVGMGNSVMRAKTARFEERRRQTAAAAAPSSHLLRSAESGAAAAGLLRPAQEDNRCGGEPLLRPANVDEGHSDQESAVPGDETGRT